MHTLLNEKETKGMSYKEALVLHIEKRREIIKEVVDAIKSVLNNALFEVRGLNKADELVSVMVQFKPGLILYPKPKSIVAFRIRLHFFDSEIFLEDLLTGKKNSFRYGSPQDIERFILAIKAILVEAQKEKGYL